MRMRKRRKPVPHLLNAQDIHPLAGMLPADLRKRGIEIQVYAYLGRQVAWAGVHWAPEISARTAYYVERHWRRWRRWYDNLPANRARHYPAKEGPRGADTLILFPVHQPAARSIYRIPTGEAS